MQQHSVGYIVTFAALLCIACAIMVSTSAVSLEERQEANAALDEQLNVLEAAGVIEPGEKLTAEEVDAELANIDIVLVDIESGEEVQPEGIDPLTYKQLEAQNDPDMSYQAPSNGSNIKRIAKYARVYKIKGEDGGVGALVLPIEGYGLWGTLYGFVAIDPDDNQVVGLTYYKHKETPGLGGEVDNPRWKALWPGRKIYEDDGEVGIEVIKGSAGPVAEEPYKVDGLSGATITSRGITNMLVFWLGPDGFGPYLDKFQTSETQRSAA